MNRPLVVLAALAVLGACPKGGDKPKPEPAGRGDAQSRLLPDDDAGVALPPAPPLPAAPASMPPPPQRPRVTAEAVAFGELLFFDPRMSAGGKLACASCHDPARGFSGGIDNTSAGKQNLRRTPALVDLAWGTAFGWDGRAATLGEHLPVHAAGQLDAIDAATIRIAAVPTYRAHIARVGGAPGDAIVQALEAYVFTRFEADTPWDVKERTARATPGAAPSDPILAGYQVFIGKGRCAVCHPPPLYTDNAYHRVVVETLGDKGRGLVEPALTGAFKTPTLRGAGVRRAYFHTGAPDTLDEVIAHYQNVARHGAQEPPGLDPTLANISLTPDEAKQLAMFLNALTSDRPRPIKPLLP